MSFQAAADEYAQALRQGQKEYRELLMSGREPYPLVLDELLPDGVSDSAVNVGLVEIPVERIVGVKSAGRTSAFTANFLPLLEQLVKTGKKLVIIAEDVEGDALATLLVNRLRGNFTCVCVTSMSRRATSGSAYCATLVPPGSPPTLNELSLPSLRIPASAHITNFWTFTRVPNPMCSSSAAPETTPSSWPRLARNLVMSGPRTNAESSTPISTISWMPSIP